MLNTLHLGKATCTVTGYRVTNMVLPDLRLFLQYEDTLNKEQERGDTMQSTQYAAPEVLPV